jgi:AcrR family transcriptional regulator
MTRKTDSPRPARALRADARRNRERVLQAAEAVFTAQGTSASTEAIARHAGVGMGTVFRHFPTKEALLAAIIVTRQQHLIERAREQLAGAHDPGEAFFSFFERMVEQASTKKVFADALASAGVDVKKVVSPAARELREAIGALLSRAQAAGAVSADVTAAEVMALLIGAVRAAEHAGHDQRLKARTLELVLAGLRPRAPSGKGRAGR